MADPSPTFNWYSEEESKTRRWAPTCTCNSRMVGPLPIIHKDRDLDGKVWFALKRYEAKCERCRAQYVTVAKHNPSASTETDYVYPN